MTVAACKRRGVLEGGKKKAKDSIEGRLTLADFGFAPAAFLELVEGVYHGEDLHGAHSVEHVRIVARCGAEAAAVVLAREHKVYGLVARQGVRMAEQVQGDKAPVDAIQAQMFCEPVVVLIFAGIQTLDILDMVGSGKLQLIGEFVELCCHIGILDLVWDGAAMRKYVLMLDEGSWGVPRLSLESLVSDATKLPGGLLAPIPSLSGW